MKYVLNNTNKQGSFYVIYFQLDLGLLNKILYSCGLNDFEWLCIARCNYTNIILVKQQRKSENIFVFEFDLEYY